MKSVLVLLTLVAMAVARPQFGNFGNNFGSNFGGFGRQQGGAQSQVSGLNFGNQGDFSLTGGQALASSNQLVHLRKEDPNSALGRWFSIWDHSCLLSRALLLISVLTLSGLHREWDQQPSCWSLGLLLTASVSVACAVSTSAFIVTVSTVWEFLYSLTMFFTQLHAMLVLAYLIYRRRQLLDLVRRIADLDRATSAWRRPNDHCELQRKAALLCAVTFTPMFVWLGVTLTKELTHPNYILSARLPDAMLTPAWYPVVMVLQSFFCVCTMSLQVFFEVLLLGMADSVTAFTERLGTFCQRQISDQDSPESSVTDWKDERGDNSDRTPLPAYGEKPNPNTNKLTLVFNPEKHFNHDIQSPELMLHNLGKDETPTKPRAPIAWTIGSSSSNRDHLASNIPTEGHFTEAPGARPTTVGDLETRLDLLTSLFDSVRRLADDNAEFCSLPTLSLYSSVAAGLLLGSYASMVLRLLIVSCAGTRLIQQGRQLHDQLAAGQLAPPRSRRARASASSSCWSGAVSRPRCTAGSCSPVQKDAMLSLFGFVLTYIVILIQMQVR
ncbi:hypothetical protein FJT64_009506 [Amphibalanus amphitrite]|uniref:Odorant receptor n=1 Tax=Amphibalanus amphitrite TaxID=1232801 RepID=A0A6A4VQW7_AMPAM|nr:hypothetical protein FJT64_009506 [Amphibalanus amphitrite]